QGHPHRNGARGSERSADAVQRPWAGAVEARRNRGPPRGERQRARAQRRARLRRRDPAEMKMVSDTLFGKNGVRHHFSGHRSRTRLVYARSRKLAGLPYVSSNSSVGRAATICSRLAPSSIKPESRSRTVESIATYASRTA